jgi:hypothetical protein
MSSVAIPVPGVAGARASAGDHSARLALRLLWGVPLGFAVVIGWQLVMQTSAMFDADERITGWDAVARDLPAMVLVLAPVIVGLAVAVHAARLGSRRGRRAIWWLSAALWFAVLNMIATLVDDTGISPTPKLVGTWVPPLVIAAGAAVFAFRASQQTDRATTAPPVRGYVRAAGPAAVAVAIAMVWLFASQAALSHRAGTFARAGVPGTATLQADGPGPSFVYAEGGAGSAAELDLTVTDADSRAVDLAIVPPEPQYLRNMRGGRVVARFDAAAKGPYSVTSNAAVPSTTAPYAPQNPYGTFAVGGSVAGWMDPAEWGSTVLIALAVALTALLTWRTAHATAVTQP